MQRDARLEPHHRTNGTSSVTRIESIQQGQEQIEQQMQGFGRQQEETNALGTHSKRLV